MNLEMYQLTGSYFHFGEQGLGQEETRAFWSSDSLFAALVARLALLQGTQAVKNWMQPFLNGSPPFLLTSLFPYAKSVRFFPIPLAAQMPDEHPLPKNLRPKDLKKAQFASESLYRQLLAGKSLLDLLPESEQLQEGKVWLTREEAAALNPTKDRAFRLWGVEKRPRVTVERPSNASQLFHVGTVHFAPGCGLWFGVHWLNPDSFHKSTFPMVLADLGDAGLGAERSAGYGKGIFTLKETLTLPNPGALWTSLSRYLPRENEMEAFQHERAAWKLYTVGGWLDSPQKHGQRRRILNFVREGAVLSMPAGQILPLGRIEDACPRYANDEEFPVPHPVYRCGLSVAVGYGGDS